MDLSFLPVSSGLCALESLLRACQEQQRVPTRPSQQGVGTR